MSSPSDQHQANVLSQLEPRCIANTKSSINGRVEDYDASSQCTNSKYPNNFFKEAQLSPDGTVIVTSNDDRRLRAYIISSDFLDDSKQPHTLSPCSVLPSPTNVQSFALYPNFNLSDPNTTWLLSASAEQPIRLTNVLDPTYTHGPYSYINKNTEAFIAPTALAFTPNCQYFVAGSQGAIAVFDVLDPKARIVKTHKTKPRDPKAAVASMRDSGLIMSLSIAQDGLLAAGSSNRTVGIYSHCGIGEYVTSFSVAPQPGEADAALMGGTGITSLAWTPDKNYLLAAERQSNGIHVYDVRWQGRRLAWLAGRNALTTQRLGISTVYPSTGLEVWAGGVDGAVRMWKQPGLSEGVQNPDAEFHGMHNDAISSVLWHREAYIMATSSGRRHFRAYEESDSKESDSEESEDEESEDEESEDSESEDEESENNQSEDEANDEENSDNEQNDGEKHDGANNEGEKHGVEQNDLIMQNHVSDDKKTDNKKSNDEETAGEKNGDEQNHAIMQTDNESSDGEKHGDENNGDDQNDVMMQIDDGKTDHEKTENEKTDNEKTDNIKAENERAENERAENEETDNARNDRAKSDGNKASNSDNTLRIWMMGTERYAMPLNEKYTLPGRAPNTTVCRWPPITRN